MKVRLLKGGGILGRTQLAEAELVYRSFTLQRSFEDFFRSLPADEPDVNVLPDAFHYRIEFNGDLATLPETDPDDAEVAGFIHELKQGLRYQ